MKRIFTALKIEGDENFFKTISSLKSVLSGENIKWAEKDNLHITLSFLGNTEEKFIFPIEKMLKEKCEGSGKFKIVLRGLGVFKNHKDPHVLWAGIDPSDELMNLNSIIIDGLKETGIIIQDRPFSPHLTLGRIRRLKEKTALEMLLDEYSNTIILETYIDRIILFESILQQPGPVYRPLSVHEL
jgi:2'-5' RNA ligase